MPQSKPMNWLLIYFFLLFSLIIFFLNLPSNVYKFFQAKKIKNVNNKKVLKW